LQSIVLMLANISSSVDSGLFNGRTCQSDLIVYQPHGKMTVFFSFLFFIMTRNSCALPTPLVDILNVRHSFPVVVSHCPYIVLYVGYYAISCCTRQILVTTHSLHAIGYRNLNCVFMPSRGQYMYYRWSHLGSLNTLLLYRQMVLVLLSKFNPALLPDDKGKKCHTEHVEEKGLRVL